MIQFKTLCVTIIVMFCLVFTSKFVARGFLHYNHSKEIAELEGRAIIFGSTLSCVIYTYVAARFREQWIANLKHKYTEIKAS